MNTSKPTRGQVERMLTQRIQALYQENLGQRPEKVTCQFFDEKLAIVLEETLTRSEQLLLNTDGEKSVAELRSQLDEAIKPQLLKLIEEVVGVSVKIMLFDTDLTNGVSGIITILNGPPLVRDPESIPKAKIDKMEAIDSE